jgi:hypothetical protein
VLPYHFTPSNARQFYSSRERCNVNGRPQEFAISYTGEMVAYVKCSSAVRRSAGGRSSAGAPAVFYQPEPEPLCFLPSSGWKIRMTYITSVILLQENMQYYRTYSRHSLL